MRFLSYFYRIYRRGLQSLFDKDRALLIAELVSNCDYEKYFSLWQQHGFHITPNHFYQPIPNTTTLHNDLWNMESDLKGINMNIDGQLYFLRNVFPLFEQEYTKFPTKPTGVPYEFHLNNGYLDGLDAFVLWCMVRHFKPNNMIESGSGYSTFVSAQAALKNGNTNLISIEPYPNEILKHGFPGLSQLYTQKIEDVDINIFKELKENDILFIDTSHCVRIGGDVNKIYLEIIPILNEGVIVHIHDIFFPWEYPKNWVLEMHRFWTEQYLLQAFLIFNSEFEILFSNSYMDYKYGTELRKVFPNSPCGGSSLWMRRK